MTEREILQEMASRVEKGEPFALATVIDSTGSSPRKPGAKMLVRPDGSILGSVGGGQVDMETLAAAKSVLEEGTPRTLSFVLTEEHGYVCGGTMKVYLEPYGIAPRLVMFGAGHVGRAVGALAATCGFRVTLVDERSECCAREHCSFADEILCCPIDDAFLRAEFTEDTSVVIAMPGHVHDFAAVRGSLRTSAGFIGLMGSRRKRAALLEALHAEGYPDDQMQRIITPVGLAIGAQTPEELAVSIVGQLIQHRRERNATSSSDCCCSRDVPAHGVLQAAP